MIFRARHDDLPPGQRRGCPRRWNAKQRRTGDASDPATTIGSALRPVKIGDCHHMNSIDQANVSRRTTCSRTATPSPGSARSESAPASCTHGFVDQIVLNRGFVGLEVDDIAVRRDREMCRLAAVLRALLQLCALYRQAGSLDHRDDRAAARQTEAATGVESGRHRRRPTRSAAGTSPGSTHPRRFRSVCVAAARSARSRRDRLEGVAARSTAGRTAPIASIRSIAVSTSQSP